MAVSEKSILNKIDKDSLAEELRKERESNVLAVDQRYSHKEDLESLLKLAEELKEKCDKARHQIRVLKFGRIITVVTFILSILFLFLESIKSGVDTFTDLNFGIKVLTTLGFLVLSLVAEFVIRNIERTYLPDKLALSEVLQLLRETSDIIAEQEEWSVLSRAEFRIRLSRFNLEEKPKSALNFFS